MQKETSRSSSMPSLLTTSGKLPLQTFITQEPSSTKLQENQCECLSVPKKITWQNSETQSTRLRPKSMEQFIRCLIRDYFKEYPNAAIIDVCIGDTIASTPVGEFNLDSYILVVNRQMKYPWVVMSERTGTGLRIKKENETVRVQWTWYKKYPEKVIVFPILSTEGARLVGLPDVLSGSFRELVKHFKYGGDIVLPKDGFYMGRANIIVCSNLVQHNGPSTNQTYLRYND